MKKLYIVAGEMSGDARGAELMRALREAGGDFEFGGVGGSLMCAEPGAERVQDWVDEAGVVGLWEVLKKYPYFRGEFARVRTEVKAWNADAVILIDYPGFNLRLAKAFRKDRPDLKIIYYVSPQVWAWNRGRIRKMAKMLDLMICIFPFEKALYDESGLRAVFAGHPIVQELGALKGQFEREDELVALFPGSREREVAKLFPEMLEAAVLIKSERPETRFIASAASVSLARYMRGLLDESTLVNEVDFEIVRDRSYEIMQRATCGVIASGTATLEAAFFGLPYCLVYRVAWPTYVIGKALIKVDYMGIINILAGRSLVTELIQVDANSERIASQIRRFLNSETERDKIRGELVEEIKQLGGEGAAGRAAQAILATVYLRGKSAEEGAQPEQSDD